VQAYILSFKHLTFCEMLTNITSFVIKTDPSGGCREWTAMRDSASIVLQKSPYRPATQCIIYTRYKS